MEINFLILVSGNEKSPFCGFLWAEKKLADLKKFHKFCHISQNWKVDHVSDKLVPMLWWKKYNSFTKPNPCIPLELKIGDCDKMQIDFQATS